MLFRTNAEKLLISSSLFDHDFIRKQFKSFPTSRTVAVKKYLESRDLWTIKTHPLFDGGYYLENNSDVLQASINPLVHYLTHGDKEGRVTHPILSLKPSIDPEGSLPRGKSSLEEFLALTPSTAEPPFPGFDYEVCTQILGEKRTNLELLAELVTYLQDYKSQSFFLKLAESNLSRSSRSPILGSLKEEEKATRDISGLKGQCDVVIPVKNGVDWMVRAIDSIFSSEDLKRISTITIVNDGCSEESRLIIDEIVKRDPRLVVVDNRYAKGFAGACNSGFLNSACDYVLFLNSDCLINSRTISKMLDAFENEAVGLACPLSNNAANASLPMPEGESFVSMDSLVEEESKGIPNKHPDICTIVGHCLMVSRKCYESLGGMDESWGLGYGEESDLHLRARAKGFLGVLVSDAYVYHFGGGTFRYEKSRAELQAKNHRRFLRLWGAAYESYSFISGLFNPIPALEKRISNAIQSRAEVKCDILFVLPCIIQGIGGVHVVLDLCNHLILNGFNCRVAVVGPMDRQALADYPEPLFFNPTQVHDVDSWVANTKLNPKIIVSTLYSTVPPAWRLAKIKGARLVNFLQGFEFFFDGGRPYEDVRDSYFLADSLITTSSWMAKRVAEKHPSGDIIKLPLGSNKYSFYPFNNKDLAGSAKLRVGMVFRSSVDKGQFILRDLLDMLSSHPSQFSLTIFKPDDYPIPSAKENGSDVIVVKLPASRTLIAENLRDVDIFVDASLHEGYGLFPLEAMACGACVVASDSGGITQYLEDGFNGKIVTAVNKPEAFYDVIQKLHQDRTELKRLRENGCLSAKNYDEAVCFDGFKEYFLDALSRKVSHDPNTIAAFGG